MVDGTEYPGLFAWLASGERGISSNTIVTVITGIPAMGSWPMRDYPYDPSDFRRCELLLRAVPALRPLMPKMAAESPQWARLVEHWTEIDALIEADVPGYLAGNEGRANRAYDLMHELTKR